MIQFKGGDGSSKENSIIIFAENEVHGIDAEYEYFEQNYGKVEIESQSFFDEGNKKYDCLNIISPTEQKKEIWFDITDFCGKE